MMKKDEIWILPYLFRHCSKKGNRAAAQLWVSVEESFTAVDRDFLISLMLPSRKDGGGPLIPWLLRIDLSFSGLTTRALYRRKNSPRTPAKARDMNTLTVKASISETLTLLRSTASLGVLGCLLHSVWGHLYRDTARLFVSRPQTKFRG